MIKLEGGSEQDLKVLDAHLNGNNDSDEVKEIKADKPAKIDASTDEIKTESRASDAEETSPPKEESTTNEDDSKSNGKSSRKRKSEDSGSESGAYTDSDEEDEAAGTSGEHKKKKSHRQKNTAESSSSSSAKTNNRNLHRTASIFMRNLAPSVTKQDLENLCKSSEGFKRVALSDPAPERGFFRRGWLTFESHVDVKKICWSLQSTKVIDAYFSHQNQFI